MRGRREHTLSQYHCWDERQEHPLDFPLLSVCAPSSSHSLIFSLSAWGSACGLTSLCHKQQLLTDERKHQEKDQLTFTLVYLLQIGFTTKVLMLFVVTHWQTWTESVETVKKAAVRQLSMQIWQHLYPTFNRIGKKSAELTFPSTAGGAQHAHKTSGWNQRPHNTLSISHYAVKWTIH